MRTLRGLWQALRAWVAGGDRNSDLGEELESVVQMHMDNHLGEGMRREEARRQALIELGGIEQVRQAVRDRCGLPSLEGMVRDVKYAIRALVRTPGFSIVAVAGDGARHWSKRRVVHRGALRSSAPAAVCRPGSPGRAL